MTTIARTKLSGSTDGRGVKVAATSSSGTTIHQAHSTAIDEVYLYAVNSSSSSVKLTLQWGGTSSPDDDIEVTIQGEAGLVLVAPGLPVTNSIVVRAFASTANVVVLHGWVNRIT